MVSRVSSWQDVAADFGLTFNTEVTSEIQPVSGRSPLVAREISRYSCACQMPSGLSSSKYLHSECGAHFLCAASIHSLFSSFSSPGPDFLGGNRDECQFRALNFIGEMHALD